MNLDSRDLCYEEMSFAYRQKEREELAREQIHAQMTEEEYWIVRTQSEFNSQFWSAISEGRNPDFFEARINNIPGHSNIVWAVAKSFIERGFFLMLSNIGEQRMLTRDLNSWYPDFRSDVLKEDAEYTISVYLKKTT